MRESAAISKRPLEVPADLLDKWQTIADILAEVLAVPAALITRLDGSEFGVLIASRSAGNPYHGMGKVHLPDTGLYCETTMRNRQMLLIPNALQDEKWRDNPGVKLGMISYLGFPILLPDDEIFGTLCILDQKENAFCGNYQKLVLQFKELIEGHLQLLQTTALLQDALLQVKTLQGLLPICSHCKKIRNDQGYWQQIEAYLGQHSEVQFTHSICPDCMRKYYPEYL